MMVYVGYTRLVYQSLGPSEYGILLVDERVQPGTYFNETVEVGFGNRLVRFPAGNQTLKSDDFQL